MIVIGGPPFKNYAFGYPLRWHAIRWHGIRFSFLSQIDGISYFFSAITFSVILILVVLFFLSSFGCKLNNLNNKPSVESIVMLLFWPYVASFILETCENVASKFSVLQTTHTSCTKCLVRVEILFPEWFSISWHVFIHCPSKIFFSVEKKLCSQSCDCNNAFIQVKIMFNFITFSLISSRFALIYLIQLLFVMHFPLFFWFLLLLAFAPAAVLQFTDLTESFSHQIH